MIPADDMMMPMVGVSYFDRTAKTFGRKPRSAMPCTWYESLDISAWYCPIWLAAAAAMIQ